MIARCRYPLDPMPHCSIGFQYQASDGGFFIWALEFGLRPGTGEWSLYYLLSADLDSGHVFNEVGDSRVVRAALALVHE